MNQWPVLPVMQCDRDCDLCCGPVLCSPSEFGRIRQYIERNTVQPLAQGLLTCPFYQGGQCAIYEVRPFTCRVFGHFANEHLQCPRGYNVNVTPEREYELEVEYQRRCGRPSSGRMLHEFVYSLDEIGEMAKEESKLPNWKAAC